MRRAYYLASKENASMRKFLALALCVATTTVEAAPIAGAGSIRAAIEVDAPIQTVACARYGWRGWGVYAGCFGRPYVVATPYYAPVPVDVSPSAYIRPPRRCWIDGAWLPC